MRNPLTIEAFLEFAEKQPADGAYHYDDWELCACAQYAGTLGLVSDDWIMSAMINPEGFWITANRAAAGWPRTYQALASRLRASLNTGKVQP